MIQEQRPIPETYWVEAGKLLAGEYPGHWEEALSRQRMIAFLQAGFDTFIDLTMPGELIPYSSILSEEAHLRGKAIQYSRFAIPDRSVPGRANMVAILDCIDTAMAHGRKVYVHCWGGVGRTGTTVGCYLVRHGLAGEEALRRLSNWWQKVPKHNLHPRSPETEEQVAFIRGWDEELGKRNT